MSSKETKSKTLRYGSGFEALLSAISTNESAARRALALIGADTVGQDLSGVLSDLRQTLGTDLPLEIYNTLQKIYQRIALKVSSSVAGHGVPQPVLNAPKMVLQERLDRRGDAATSDGWMPDESELEVQLPDADPLADLGIEYG